MRVLITGGPTHEPIDPVRYIGNHSTGRMAIALAAATLKAGHIPTLILGPVTLPVPANLHRIDVQTAAQMLQAMLKEMPVQDLLIFAAAVADYRPKMFHQQKIARHGDLTIECEPTEDIAAVAGERKLPHQRTIGFALESSGDLQRAREKLFAKKLDLIVYNPLATMGSAAIEPILIYPDGRTESLASASKSEFADNLLERATALWR
jgi:phosphopantothenoylcysteine decarboxylase/phosphopantothenate--cysteine ligase